jgi:hypothetical protein
MDVEQMNESEIQALIAFIDSLKNSVVKPYRGKIFKEKEGKAGLKSQAKA